MSNIYKDNAVLFGKVPIQLTAHIYNHELVI